MAAELIGGRYRLDELLGRTGMSEVWAAHDTELRRRVAVKLLAPDADRARFDREARAAATLSHPNITQIYDYGEAGGRPYMVLEYLPRGTLEDRLAGGKPLPDETSERIAREVAAGLADAHQHGIVHRDLKPGNVLFDVEGRAKLADFGIARLGHGGTLTDAGTVLGTAAYISPEQAAGETATPASDVYSFGVLLFRMLTGRLPFEAEHPLDLVVMHQKQPAPPVGRFRSDAPAALEALAAAALAKDPLERPPDGGALLAELGGPPTTSTFAAGQPTQVLPRARRPRRRRPRLLLVAPLLALILAGGLGAAYAITRTSGSNTVQTESSVSILPLRKRDRTTSTAPTTTPATTTAKTTTAKTTTAATTRKRATTPAPPLTTTAAPPPTTTAPPPTTTAPPPTTTTAPGPPPTTG
jgi:eukaryotic-like serine/threonine-protein kinase